MRRRRSPVLFTTTTMLRLRLPDMVRRQDDQRTAVQSTPRMRQSLHCDHLDMI